jgi:hypothetical protein
MINSSVLIRPVDAMWTSDYELDDYDMWMRLRYIKHRTFYNIPGVLTYHRIRKSSAFNASGVQDIDGFKKAWIRRIEELKNQRKKG